MKHFEGTDSSDKPRNQILETPEERRPRNQILAMPEGRDSSEKNEKINQNEGTNSNSEKVDSSSRGRLSGFLEKLKGHDNKKEQSETGEKVDSSSKGGLGGFLEKLKGHDNKKEQSETGEKIDSSFKDGWRGFVEKLKGHDNKKVQSEVNEPELKKEATEEKKPEFDFSWGTFRRGETKTNDASDNKKKSETGNSSDDSDSPHGHADREIGDDKPYNGQPETKNRDSREQSDEQQREIDKKKAANLKANQQIQNLHGIDAINRNNEAAKQKEAKEQEKAKQKEDDDREL